MNNGTVLIVDDNEVNLELYRELMSLTSWPAETLMAARDVLPRVVADPPSLVLLDLTLPDGNGIDVARTLKADQRTQDLVILALTAVRQDRLEDRLQAAGFAGLVRKPCGVEAFLEAVEWGVNGAPGGFRVFS